MAAQYLGDMGADVIKVETPEGDVTRQIGPRRSDGMSALFLANNRNKRSVVLDLKTTAGRDKLHHLAGRADVLLHSTRAGAAARIGLDYAALAAGNPRLVHCHVRGFGEGGPYSDQPAYDDIIQALCGLAMLQKVVAGEPRYLPSIMADKVTAVHTAYAIALALFHRERTGRGQEVVVPMLETMAAFTLQEHLFGAVFEPPMEGFGYPSLRQGLRRPYRTKDGHLCFLPYTDANWACLLDKLGRADWARDPRFATQKGRQANMVAIWEELSVEIAARTNAEWAALLAGTDIPHAALNTLEDLLDDPHLVATGFWQAFEHPSEGSIRIAGESAGAAGLAGLDPAARPEAGGAHGGGVAGVGLRVRRPGGGQVVVGVTALGDVAGGGERGVEEM